MFTPLLAPNRYKGIHGGRGSGKSHFFAELLTERCVMNPGTRWVCIREMQKSLEQSVKRTIEDKIQKLGLGSAFRVQHDQIVTPGGGLIIFQGMQNYTAESIKSLEGYDGAWAEEAQTLSARSLRLLRPTLRKNGSELWFSWNPESPEDPVDVLLRGDHRVKDAIVVEANWRDNPWFPYELREEMRIDREREAEDFDHVWNGEYVTRSEAIIFRKRVEVRAFETPKNARFFFGADFGYSTDPSVLVRSFIQDDCLFVDYEAYAYHVETDELSQLYDSIPGSRLWPIKADASAPATISWLARLGFRIAPAEKWQGSVEDGLAHLRAFKKIVVHERCPHTAKEFRLYSYKTDPKTGDVLPIIVDKFNHSVDSIRYSLDGFILRRGANKLWETLGAD